MDKAIAQWVKVHRAGPFFTAEFRNEGHHYRVKPTVNHCRVGIGYSGSINIELIQPLGPPPSILHEILDTRGEGIHHFWNRSKDLDADMAHYEACGFPVVAGGPVPGIGRSYFVDTTSAFGVFTELQELTDAVYVALDEMHQAHLMWDGHTDPIRPYPALRG